MPHLRKPGILVALIAGATLAGVAPASAEISVGVSPAILDLKAEAGGQGHVEFNVANRGDEPFEVVTSVDSYMGVLDDRSAVDWLTVRPRRLRLDPDEVRTAELIIEIPEAIESGGRYATISFTTVPPDSDATTAALAGRIVVPVHMALKGRGELVRRPTLERIALFLQADERLGIRAQVHNAGNVHAPLAGKVEISSPGSAMRAALEIPMGRALPGLTRDYTGQGSLPLPLGETYDVTMRLGSPAALEGQEAGSVIDHAFTLEPTAELIVDGLAICENLDRGPSISGELMNGGNLGLVPTVQFRVLDEAGSPVGTTGPSGPPAVWPDESVRVDGQLAQRLVSGSYTLVATATFGLDSGVEASIPFSVGGDPATAAPLCPPLADPTATTESSS